ncbi:MAG: hydrogenase maturation nickel metallochaperone HypA [bacterium]
MHEMFLANALLQQVLEIAGQHDLETVEEIEVEIGEGQHVDPEALAIGFEALSQDSLAAAAELRLTPVSLQARCRECETLFAPELLSFSCPSCRQADAEIIAGRDVILKSLSGPTRDPEETP